MFNIRLFVSRYSLPIFVTLLYLFLYIPLIVLVTFSFNQVSLPYQWAGFSLHWYKVLFESSEIWQAFKTSCIVACSAVLLSLVMGTLLVFYSRWSRLKFLVPTFYANLLLPEIVMAVNLLTLFLFLSIPLGYMTLIVGHTLLGLGFVIPIVATRLAQLEESIIEASLDLGATINQTFWYVIIPMLRPALVVSGLLVFIISFDDFLISFFCAGATTQTLSLYIFAMIRTGIVPTVNALSSLLFLLTTVLVLLYFSVRSKIRIF